MSLIDLTGTRFGKWYVTGLARSGRRGGTAWFVTCDCGAQRTVPSNNLKRGVSRSCGCAPKPPRTHGEGAGGKKRGYLYKLWTGIKCRCYNTNVKQYKNYGGAGIKVFDDWLHDYPAFAKWIRENIGERPNADWSLDRIKTEGNYEPGNLQWATRKMQVHTQRRHVALREREGLKVRIAAMEATVDQLLSLLPEYANAA